MAIDQSREAVLRRVRGLMATRDDEGNHQEERDSAADLAMKLMTKHQIEDAEVAASMPHTGPAKIVTFKVEVTNQHGMGKLRVTALHRAVLLPLGGNSYFHQFKSAKAPCVMTVFVPEDVEEFAKVLLESFLRQMNDGMAQATRLHLDSLYSWTTTKERNKASLLFRRGYLEAWGTRVMNRMKAVRARTVEQHRLELMAEAYANGADGEELARIGSAVALRDPKEQTRSFMNDWHARLYGGHKVGKARPSRFAVSGDGQRAGRADGDRADIGLKALAA